MGRLAIRRVRYQGDLYAFDYDRLSDGLIILEGDNGAGKTTFCQLIYFGLGGNVAEFKTGSTKKHKEVTSDRNNFVELRLEFDDGQFEVRRFIGSNDVGIQTIGKPEEVVEVLPIMRRDNAVTYSDWI